MRRRPRSRAPRRAAGRAACATPPRRARRAPAGGPQSRCARPRGGAPPAPPPPAPRGPCPPRAGPPLAAPPLLPARLRLALYSARLAAPPPQPLAPPGRLRPGGPGLAVQPPEPLLCRAEPRGQPLYQGAGLGGLALRVG